MKSLRTKGISMMLAGLALVGASMTEPAVAAQAKAGELLEEVRVPGRAISLATADDRVFAFGMLTSSDQEEPEQILLRAYGPERELLWEDRYAGDPDSVSVSGEAMAARAGMVITVGKTRKEYPRYNRTYMVLRAYNPETGDILWERKDGVYESTIIHDLTFHGDFLYLLEGRNVLAYLAATGRLMWTARFWDYPESIEADDNSVFVTGSTKSWSTGHQLVQAYDASTGVKLWKDRVGALAIESRTYDSASTGRILITVGQDSRRMSRVRALDALSGELLWESRDGAMLGFNKAARVIIQGDQVHVAGRLNAESNCGSFPTMGVLSFDLNSGVLLWNSRLDNDDDGYMSESSAVTALGRDVCTTGSIHETDTPFGYRSSRRLAVQCYDRKSGKVLWDQVVGSQAGEDEIGVDMELTRKMAVVAGTLNATSEDREFALLFYSRGPRAQDPGNQKQRSNTSD